MPAGRGVLGWVGLLMTEPPEVSRLTTIRTAAAADLAASARLAAAHRGGEYAAWLARLAADFDHPQACLLVAEDSARLTGYGRVRRFSPSPDGPASLAPPGYYLSGLLVHPGYRRRGIGGLLTRARMAWTAARAGEIWYFTDAGNQASLRLHQRLGFREVTRDFTFPQVTFEGGVGVLGRAQLEPAGLTGRSAAGPFAGPGQRGGPARRLSSRRSPAGR
jgi:ribosomal protein S18 acetylase RimI-like enzyme